MSNTVRKRSCLAVSVFLIALTFFAPNICRAQAKCPWLNAATAAGILGGDVQMAVKVTREIPGKPKVEPGVYDEDQMRMDRNDVTCEFTRKVDSTVYLLGIAVTTMTDPAKEFAAFPARCTGGTIPLKAIGNEAVQCFLKPTGGMDAQEQVIARVRDRAFVMTIQRKLPRDSGTNLRDDTRNIAEQVAGSLF